MQVQSLVSLSGLRIQHCRDLWCRLQTRFGCAVAVAVASSCNSDSTPSLGTSVCYGYGPKKGKKKKSKRTLDKWQLMIFSGLIPGLWLWVRLAVAICILFQSHSILMRLRLSPHLATRKLRLSQAE